MKLSYFLEEAYDELITNVGKNVERYIQDADWLDDYFHNQEYSKDSTVDFSIPELFKFSSRLNKEDKTKEDIANVKRLYGELKGLSPLQASNKLMWTCLAHTSCRDYVIHRWIDDEKFSSSDENAQINRIKRRFFVTSETRSLNTNAISRLWWYGFISHDPSNTSNPFYLTEFLVGNTKFCTDFIQTPQCWNRTVGKGILLAASEFILLLEKNEGISGYYRPLKKYLNRYGAVTAIDSLDENEVRKLALEYLNNLRNKQRIPEDIEHDSDEDQD